MKYSVKLRMRDLNVFISKFYFDKWKQEIKLDIGQDCANISYWKKNTYFNNNLIIFITCSKRYFDIKPRHATQQHIKLCQFAVVWTTKDPTRFDTASVVAYKINSWFRTVHDGPSIGLKSGKGSLLLDWCDCLNDTCSKMNRNISLSLYFMKVCKYILNLYKSLNKDIKYECSFYHYLCIFIITILLITKNRNFLR